MTERANLVLDNHILPLMSKDVKTSSPEINCAIFAHGIILNVIIQSLLGRCADCGIQYSDEAIQNGLALNVQGPTSFSWSNTGFVEISIRKNTQMAFKPDEMSHRSLRSCKTKLPWLMRIERVNCTSHIRELNRTRGGIGSAPFMRDNEL